jgi:hypothetical protein
MGQGIVTCAGVDHKAAGSGGIEPGMLNGRAASDRVGDEDLLPHNVTLRSVVGSETCHRVLP